MLDPARTQELAGEFLEVLREIRDTLRGMNLSLAVVKELHRDAFVDGLPVVKTKRPRKFAGKVLEEG